MPAAAEAMAERRESAEVAAQDVISVRGAGNAQKAWAPATCEKRIPSYYTGTARVDMNGQG
jgi:hypothetical protein